MIEIVEADLSLPAHADAMIQLMDEYALDPMGGGKGLSDYVKANLGAELAKRFAAHVILAFVDAEPAGLIVCLEGFSTFACKPLLNIHDVIVALPYRGRGLSKLLLQKAEEIALAEGLLQTYARGTGRKPCCSVSIQGVWIQWLRAKSRDGQSIILGKETSRGD
jgi:GNAT superfamily N-acetyltransferase